jgi:NADH dehydrogenase FAD-containing subunit
MKRLVLAGGGHAHLAVLEHFAKAPVANLELVLATPARYQYYSGMLPGWLAGHYAQAQCRIDLAALAARAGARLIQAPVRQLRADARTLELGDGGAGAWLTTCCRWT